MSKQVKVSLLLNPELHRLFKIAVAAQGRGHNIQTVLKGFVRAYVDQHPVVETKCKSKDLSIEEEVGIYNWA